MRLVSSEMVELLKERFGEDFVFGIETSANEQGVYTGMKNYITIYSNHVSQQEEVILDGVTVYINPMPKEDVYVVGERLLSYESIFLLTVKRDEFVTGQSWDTLTRIAEEWGLEKTKEVLNRLPAELYEMNAQDFIEHFSSDSFGA